MSDNYRVPAALCWLVAQRTLHTKSIMSGRRRTKNQRSTTTQLGGQQLSVCLMGGQTNGILKYFPKGNILVFDTEFPLQWATPFSIVAVVVVQLKDT